MPTSIVHDEVDWLLERDPIRHLLSKSSTDFRHDLEHEGGVTRDVFSDVRSCWQPLKELKIIHGEWPNNIIFTADVFVG